MSQGTVNGSPADEVIKSSAHELDQVPVSVPVGLEWQQLWVERLYSGYSAQWLPGFFGTSDPGTPMWFPTSSWRQNFRKVYKNLVVGYSGTFVYDTDPAGPYWPYPSPPSPASFSLSFTSTNALSGAGNTPQDDYLTGGHGMPQNWTLDPTFPPAGMNPVWPSLSQVFQLMRCSDILCFTGADEGGATIGFMIDFSYAHNWEYGSYLSGASYIHGSFSGFPRSVFPDGSTPHNQSWTFDLSTELVFKTLLGTVATEIQAESYPAFLAFTATKSVFNDYWENYDGSGSLTPSHWDGLVISVPGTYSGTGLTNPYFGANTGISADYAYLWSGWWWDSPYSHEENQSDAALCSVKIDPTLPMNIEAQRTRFKTSTAQTYCILEATVPRLVRFDGAAMSAADISEVKLKASGTTTPGTLIDIPWPTDPGYDDWRSVGANDLSVGKIRFAIIGETAAAWSARTGIPYT